MRLSTSVRYGWLRLFAFASPWFAVGAMTLPLSIFLPPLYAGEVGLGLLLTGQIVMASRIFDIVIDPFIGAWSDASRSRYGRRKSFIVPGMLIFFSGIALLLNPGVFLPPQSGWSGSYFLIASVMTALGSSLIVVPHSAWSSELSAGYHERSRVMGMNEWVNLLGVLSVAVAGTFIERIYRGETAQQMQAVSVVLMITLPVTVIVCVSLTPETEGRKQSEFTLGRVWRDPYDALKNEWFRRLSGVKFANSLAESVGQALWVFVCASVLELKAYTTTLLAIHIAMGFVSIPLWTAISYRIGKTRACGLALLWRVILVPFILVVPSGDFMIAAIFMAVIGLSLGAESSLLRSMVADVVDHHEFHTGRRLAGVFQGTFNLISNLGKALGVGVLYTLLFLSGYDTVLQTEAHEPGDYRIPALFFAFVPPALNLFGVWWLRGYKLSQHKLNALQTHLSVAREAGENAPGVKSDENPRGRT